MNPKEVTLVKYRISVYIGTSLLYTPDLSNKLRELIHKEAVVMSEMPEWPLQWGIPWNLQWNENDAKYKIAFLQNKIDIEGIVEKPVGDINLPLCIDRCIGWLEAIQQKFDIGAYLRIGYGPIYGLENNDLIEKAWRNVMGEVCLSDGIPQNKGVRFNPKSTFMLNGKTIQLNRLVTVSEGTHTITHPDNSQLIVDVCIIELDFNTFPENKYEFSDEDLKSFLHGVPSLANEMLNLIIK